MTIFEVRTADDLTALANQRGIDLDWSRPAWALVDLVIRDHEYRTVRSGPPEEVLRIAARRAVREVDPDYRGYTPFGNI